MASRRPSASPASPDSLPSAPPDPPASEVEWDAVGTSAPRRFAGRGAVVDRVVEPLPAPWIWRVYAGFTAYLGLPIIAAWIGVAVAAVVFLPDFGATAGFGLVDLVPGNTPALQAQALENRLFGSSFSDAQSVVVERDPSGIAPPTLLKIAEQARAVDSSRQSSGPASRPIFALPLVSVPGLTPALGRPATTTVTYLFFRQAAEAGDINAGSQRYAAAAPHPPGTTVGVTGSVPSQISEGSLIESSLLPLEIVTVLVIAALVGLVFRSLIAPVVPLAGAGVAYLITSHVLGLGARELAIQIPSQLSPIMVVLILGVVTDYSVFTLTGLRSRLAAGERRTWALRHAASRVVPLVIAAALTVAAGTVALIGANLDFFHAVGPGMAVAVIISGLVSISFVPALAGVLGRVTFWPSLKVTGSTPADARATVGAGRGRRLMATLLSRRWVAMVTVVVCLAALVAMGSGVTMARFGTNVVSGLPGTSGPRQAATAAADGFGPGILGPTTLTLRARNVASKSAALARIGNAVRQSPGVAAVAGPEDLPATLDASLFRTADGNAVRFIVVFRDDPYDAGAIAAYTALTPRVSAALSGVGLGSASATWSGATPTASESVASTESTIWRVGVLAALLMCLVLALYFRAVLAPLLLVASSALAVAATVGLLVYVFQGVLGYPDITFFVPIAAGVLLVSLGADYSVFVMGRIWEEARGRTMTGAVIAALPQASRAVSIAALTLVASFAVLAIVPVQPFREFAFIMGVGVLIDAFLVRSLLLPALLTLTGRAAFWPHRTARPIQA